MEIEDKRNQIDTIDEAIVELLNQRVMIVRQIGAIKTRAGLPIVDTQRESEVLTRLSRVNSGCLPDESLVRIYRGILSESRSLQSSVKTEVLAGGIL